MVITSGVFSRISYYIRFSIIFTSGLISGYFQLYFWSSPLPWSILGSEEKLTKLFSLLSIFQVVILFIWNTFLINKLVFYIIHFIFWKLYFNIERIFFTARLDKAVFRGLKVHLSCGKSYFWLVWTSFYSILVSLPILEF